MFTRRGRRASRSKVASVFIYKEFRREGCDEIKKEGCLYSKGTAAPPFSSIGMVY